MAALFIIAFSSKNWTYKLIIKEARNIVSLQNSITKYLRKVWTKAQGYEASMVFFSNRFEYDWIYFMFFYWAENASMKMFWNWTKNELNSCSQNCTYGWVMKLFSNENAKRCCRFNFILSNFADFLCGSFFL